MSNIMVCVTGQRTCQRLIDYGLEIQGEGDHLFVTHIAKSDNLFLGNVQEGEALEFLYEKAMDAGATLAVEKSDDVMVTLVELVHKNKINQVIVGESGEEKGPDNFLDILKKRLGKKTQLIVVPSTS